MLQQRLENEQVFYLQEPVVAAEDATVEGTVSMVRQANNPRLYNVKASRTRESGASLAPSTEEKAGNYRACHPLAAGLVSSTACVRARITNLKT